MGRFARSQGGFGVILVVVVLASALAVGSAGFFVYKHQHNQLIAQRAALQAATEPQPVVRSTPAPAPPTVVSQTNYIDNGAVSYVSPAGWAALDPTKAGGFPCGQSATSLVTPCVDKAILVLQKDGYANPDQFYTAVSVFPSPKAQTARAWLASLQLGKNADITQQTLAINGRAAFYYSDRLGDGSIRIFYAITSKHFAVLVYTTLFKGNHYSFQTTNNYLGYAGQVAAIAKSVAISN